MGNIHLIAQTDPNGPHDIDNCPIAKPESEIVYWNYSTRPEGWIGYLVQLIAYDVPTDILTFRGVELEAPNHTVGPNGYDPDWHYQVNLGELKYVYRMAPSSLSGYVTGNSEDHAILLLHADYIKDHDSGDYLNGARASDPADGPKWPVGSGVEKAELINALAAAKEKYSQAMSAFKTMVLDTGDYRESTINAWYTQYYV